MALRNYEVSKLINLYRARPDLFNEEQLENLSEEANSLGIRFKPLEQKVNIRRIAKQLTSGFGEGFTTIPMGAPPRTTYESIAHSMGHLAGFAPSILAAPVSLFSKGLIKIGAKTVGEKIAKGIIPKIHKVGEMSLPMIGRRHAKGLLDKGLAKSKLESLRFFKRGSASRQIIEEAVGLGTASLVSGVWRGPDSYMNTFTYGAVAGGAFGGLGNFVRLGKIFKNGNPAQVKKAENILKMGVGSAMLGLPSTLRKDPIEAQIYEYLLGGFFGYNSRPAFEQEAGKFITNTMYSNSPEHILNPAKHKDYHKYSKKVQDYLINTANESSQNWLNQWRDSDIMKILAYNQAEARHGDKKGYELTQKDIEKEFRILAYNEYVKDRESLKFESANKDAYDTDDKVDYNDPAYIYDPSVVNLSRTIFDSMPVGSGYKHVMDIADKIETHLQEHRGNRTPNVEAFIKDIYDSDIPNDIVKKNESTLRKRFHQSMKSKKEVVVGDFVEGLTIEKNDTLDGKRLGKYYFDLPIEALDPLFTLKGGSFEIMDWIRFKDSEGNIHIQKPNEFHIEKNKVVSNITPAMRKELEDMLYLDGKYIFSGNKDKKQLIIARVNTDGHSVGDVIDALSKGRISKDEIQTEYLRQLENSGNDKHFGEKWVSNVLYDAIHNGLYQLGSKDLSKIHNLTKPSYGKDAADYNKRMQGMLDTGVAQHPDSYGKPRLRYSIIEDINTTGISDTDGGIMIEHSVFDAGRDAMGFAKDIGHYKPAIMHKDKNGLLFVKAAGQRASNAWQDFMIDNGLDFIIFKSSAKRSGDIPINKVEWKNNKYEGEVDINEMAISSLRINTSTYENPYKQIGNIKIPMQMGGQLSVLQNGEIPKIYFQTITQESIMGSMEGREFANKELNDKETLKGINQYKLDELPVEFIYEILTNPEYVKSAEAIRKKIQKLDIEGELDSVEEYFGEEIYKEFHSRNKELARFADGKFAPNVFLKFLSRSNNGAIRKYILTRYINPTWEWSSKAWLKSYTPDMIKLNLVNEGEIYLDNAHKKMPVFFRDKTITLEKLWELYQKDLKAGKDISEYTDALELSVIRVPADSVSGTRVLLFKGFTDQRGAGAITADKDNRYLGGADKDSDSIFIFQNIDSRIRKEFKRHSDERKHWNDKHIEKLQSEMGYGKDKKHILTKYDPKERFIVAQKSTEGQGGLGFGLSAKMVIQEWGDIVFKNGGQIDLDYKVTTKDKYGRKHTKHYKGYVKLKNTPEDQQRFRDLGTMIVNSSADASSNPYMKQFTEHPKMLFDALLEGKISINGETPRNITLADLSKSSLGGYRTILNSVKPHGKIVEPKTGERVKPDWESTQDLIRKNQYDNPSSVFGLIGKDMAEKGITTDTLIPKEFLEYDPSGRHVTASFKYGMTGRKASTGSQIIDSIFKDISKEADGYIMSIFTLKRNQYIPSKYDNHVLNTTAEIVGKELAKMTTYELLVEQTNKLVNQVGEKEARILMSSAIYRALEAKTEAHGLSNNESRAPMDYSDFDAKISDMKSNIIFEGALNGYDGTIIARAIDYTLLSPLLLSKNVNKITKKTYFDSNFSKAAYSSDAIYNSSLKNYFAGIENVYQRSVESIKTGKEFKFAEPTNYTEAILPTEKARLITEILLKKSDIVTSEDVHKAAESIGMKWDKDVAFMKLSKKITGKEHIDDMTSNEKSKLIDAILPSDVPLKKKKVELERLALSKEHLDEITKLKENLQKSKPWHDNFNQMFGDFTSIQDRVVRDASTMTMEDVRALNRYFDDAYKKKSSEFLAKYWYMDPRSVDREMLKYDSQTFEGILTPVLTSKGVVRKQLNKVMSPIGAIREYFRKVERETVSEIERVLEDNMERFDWRKDQTKEDIQMIMNISFAQREGKALTNEMELWKLKKFTYNEKSITGEELVETANKQISDFFKQVGKEWLYTDKKMMDKWFKIDPNGKVNLNPFLKHILTTGSFKDPSPKVGLEALLRYNMERKMELTLTYEMGKENWSNAKKKSFREKYRKDNGITRERLIGKWKNIEEYMPHINVGYNKGAMREFEVYVEAKATQAYNDAIARPNTSEKQAQKEAQDVRIYWQFYRESSNRESANYEVDALQNEVGGERPDIAMKRFHEDLVGYDKRETVFDDYKKMIVRSYYRNLVAIQGNMRIDKMLEKNAFGNFTKKQNALYNPDKTIYKNQTEVWADYLNLYLKDMLGQPSTFNQRILDSIEAGDPLKLKKSMYYHTSDRQMVKALERYIKSFEKRGLSTPLFFKNMPKNEDGTYTDSEGNLTNPQREFLQRKVHDMARIEARYELLTLLANTGTFTANIFGGATMSIASGGLKNFLQSKSNKHVTEKLLINPDGSYAIQFKDGTNVKNRKDLHKWLVEKGIIDTFIQNELEYNPEFQDSLSKAGKNGKLFISQLTKLIKTNPEARNESILELARRYGITDKTLQLGGWLMQKSERINRIDAFVTHALKTRERYGLYAKDINMGDPYLFEMGMKGIETTQFLYHSAFRPAFMRTATGKVLTRFKLFAFQSVRTRAEFYKQAKYYGFKKGTDSYERFKDLFLIDMFTMALGSVFMFSLFDTALPPPWDWLQDTADLLMGDKTERNKAFFGIYPRPIAPLQVITPPITRIPISFIELLNGDYERFADYTIHTLYPFGRIVRQVEKTFNEPYGTTFTRGVRQFTRLPATKIRYKIKASEREERRRKKIEELL